MSFNNLFKIKLPYNYSLTHTHYKQGLALNNPQKLIYHKTPTNLFLCNKKSLFILLLSVPIQYLTNLILIHSRPDYMLSAPQSRGDPTPNKCPG